MQSKRIIAFFSLLVLFLEVCVYALDIPLSGVSESKGGASLGFVDMERIFQIYPQTQSAKEDYAKQLKKKREQLATKEAEMADVQNKISVLESTIKQGGAPPTGLDGTNTSADPLANVSQSIDKMKKDLEDRKSQIDELRKQAVADLAAFESQQSQLILGKIYQALRDVAIEEQVSVVVDKSSILYGDAAIDLTDKLQQRVRGY